MWNSPEITIPIGYIRWVSMYFIRVFSKLNEHLLGNGQTGSQFVRNVWNMKGGANWSSFFFSTTKIDSKVTKTTRFSYGIDSEMRQNEKRVTGINWEKLRIKYGDTILGWMVLFDLEYRAFMNKSNRERLLSCSWWKKNLPRISQFESWSWLSMGLLNSGKSLHCQWNVPHYPW